MGNPSHRTRRRRAGGRGPRLPNLALIAGLFLHPAAHISPTAAAAVGQPPSRSSPPNRPLAKRAENEHMVLADCRDRNDVVSSQMAYFLSEPNSAPQDVAVLVTTPGQAALWVNTNTTGLFTDTGVSFTSILGPRVEDGQFAGTGYNDYGNFSCYQLYYKNLYTYETTTCSQVYLCDHSDPPASTGASSGGMSQGSIIGIAVGVVGGLLFALAAGLVFWYLRRSRRAAAAAATTQGTRSSRLSSELLRSGTLSQGPGSDNGEPKSPITVAQSQPVMQQMSAVYEMDGRLFRIEMASDNGKFEMDALGHGSAELETAKGEAAATTTEAKAVSPISPGLANSPLEHDPPKSPPPEHGRIGGVTQPGKLLSSAAPAMTDTTPPAAGDAAAVPHHRRRSPGGRHKRFQPPAPRRAIPPLLLLVALVNLAWSLYQLPVSRVVESRLCREHYAVRDPSALRPDGSVPEELCKVDEVQRQLGGIQGVMEMSWVAGDFVMTIPLVALADHYGHRFVLCLNLVPRVFLLAWTFAVGYFDRALPVRAILAAPVFSFLGGDCVFNSIVYALVSDMTDDHVLRATFFGYVNAVSSIFSLQLGPALASATMTTLLWLPLWLGIAILLLAVPVISLLPLPAAHHRKPSSAAVAAATDEEDAAPLIPSSERPVTLTWKSLTTTRFRAILAILTKAPSRNFVLLLTVFFLASLASSDTKLLTLYISKRYGWRDATTRENVGNAYACLVFSVLGAAAIACSPTIWVLGPALLVYALGIALPMFTYSLLRSPGMPGEGGGGDGHGAQLFSVVMLVRTVGTLVGAVVMPGLWVMGLSIGGWALGLPYVRTGYDVCENDCTLRGAAFPDKHTLQLSLENNFSEQCPPIYIGDANAPTASSRVCLDFVGPNVYFNFESFPGYSYKDAAVTWQLMGSTPSPPTHSLTCGPSPSGDGLLCKLPFSDILGTSPATPIKDLLAGMCPNGDREALGLYLEFSGESTPLNTQSGQGCNRWGWYSTPTLADLQSGISGALYVGAGNNDLSKATDVGVWVATADASGRVTVTYLLNGPYALAEVHVDLACLPIDKCAPGQYTFGKGGLGDVASYSTGLIRYPTCSGGSKAALIVHAAVDVLVKGTVCPPKTD
ncbi:hypothetical protein C8A01DRAFT_47814 [Parachaetomium inaequale]|uniref:Major facilitator superfamily (MFS) profile domain-containing protein n=1 Tax=Parachaetomium inaequale TaxID=2588326 RepID=A0AAN6SQK1_9PEZI|nr:hypothetical protein C8A01DRAFT_47814 [Parachaetomium inaequale]